MSHSECTIRMSLDREYSYKHLTETKTHVLPPELRYIEIAYANAACVYISVYAITRHLYIYEINVMTR